MSVGVKMALVVAALGATLGGLFVLKQKVDTTPPTRRTAIAPPDAGEVVAELAPDAEVPAAPDAEPRAARTEPAARAEPAARTEPATRTEPTEPVAARTEPVVPAEDAGTAVVAHAEPIGREPVAVTAPTNAGDALLHLGGTTKTPVGREVKSATIQATASPLIQRPKNEPVKTGDLTDEEIREVVQAHEPALASCYEAKLKTARNLTGRMVLHFDVTPRGQATNFAFDGDSLKVRDCIVRRAKEWRFPKFKGDVIRVSYPLYFRPVQ